MNITNPAHLLALLVSQSLLEVRQADELSALEVVQKAVALDVLFQATGTVPLAVYHCDNLHWAAELPKVLQRLAVLLSSRRQLVPDRHEVFVDLTLLRPRVLQVLLARGRRGGSSTVQVEDELLRQLRDSTGQDNDLLSAFILGSGTAPNTSTYVRVELGTVRLEGLGEMLTTGHRRRGVGHRDVCGSHVGSYVQESCLMDS